MVSMLNKSLKIERCCFISCVQFAFLVALRGKYKSGEERGELDSNFIQFLKDHAKEDPTLKWMGKSQDKFTSPEIQNELLSIMVYNYGR